MLFTRSRGSRAARKIPDQRRGPSDETSTTPTTEPAEKTADATTRAADTGPDTTPAQQAKQGSSPTADTRLGSPTLDAKPGASGDTVKPDASAPNAKSDASGATVKPDTSNPDGKADTSNPDAKPDTSDPDASNPDGKADGSNPEAKADPWESFAPHTPRVPGRISRVLDRVVDRVDRFVRHEWLWALLGSVALAAAMTWPVLRHPTTVLAGGLREPALRAWQLAWAGHALYDRPETLWHTNTVHPEGFGYPLAAPLLGYAPFGMIGAGPFAAVLRYNLIFVAAFALATFGGYALVRQLGAGRGASWVAAAAFAYAPWRLGQADHLDALSTGGIALALAALARGHGWSLREGYRRDRVRPAWAVVGWLLAAWQLSLGLNLAVPFAYVLGVIVFVAAIGWLVRRRPPVPIKLLLADLVGAGLFAAAVAGTVLAYQRALDAQPGLHVPQRLLALSSPPLHGFLTAPGDSLLWGGLHDHPRASLAYPSGMTLLPGFFLIALAIAGLAMSSWSRLARLVLLVAVALSVVLAMGTAGPDHGDLGYLLLYRNLPGFDAVSNPGWLVVWTTLLLGILAAGALTACAGRAVAVAEAAKSERSRLRTRRVLRAMVLLPLVLVLAEGLPGYARSTVPPAPAEFGKAPAPMLVLPSSDNDDPLVLLWSTDGFRTVANGAHDTPSRLAELRRTVATFPDRESVDRLRKLGVKSVVLLREPGIEARYPAATGELSDELATELEIERSESRDAIVFDLSRCGSCTEGADADNGAGAGPDDGTDAGPDDSGNTDGPDDEDGFGPDDGEDEYLPIG